MARITGIRIENFRSLKNVTIGQLWSDSSAEPLTSITAFIGKNGTGKSTFIDALAFLADLFRLGLNEACYLRNRGGFKNLRTQGQDEPIAITISYKDENDIHMTYSVSISIDDNGFPFIALEDLLLFSSPENNKYTTLLLLLNSTGLASKDQNGFDYDEAFLAIKSDQVEHEKLGNKVKPVEICDKRRLGISVLGSLHSYDKMTDICNLILGFYINEFNAGAATELSTDIAQPHLMPDSRNLANVVQFIEQSDDTGEILGKIVNKLHGVSKVDTESTIDGMLLLRFHESQLKAPFYAAQTSAGTLKFFSYLVLLADTTPPPVICIDCPETGLHHKQLDTLISEFRTHTDKSQLFIVTHQPYLVDALEPTEVWILEKDDDGFTKATRASDVSLVTNMVSEGLTLGGLWYSDYFDAQ